LEWDVCGEWAKGCGDSQQESGIYLFSFGPASGFGVALVRECWLADGRAASQVLPASNRLSQLERQVRFRYCSS